MVGTETVQVKPDPSVIIIFGAAVLPGGAPSGTLRRRVAAAAACGAADPQALYMPTGGVGRHGPSEARVMAGLLAEHGVPGRRIILEERGTDTLSSVRACLRLRRTHGLCGPVRVATSGYHLPRCVLLLRLAGVAAAACPPPHASPRWAQRWYWRLREVPALPWDALLMLLARLRRRIG